MLIDSEFLMLLFYLATPTPENEPKIINIPVKGHLICQRPKTVNLWNTFHPRSSH